MNPLLSHVLIGVFCSVIAFCAGYSLRERGKFNSNIVMAVGVVVISITAMAGLFVSINAYRDATTCQAQYNVNFTQALKERNTAASTDRQATRTMIAAVLSPTGSVESRRAAIEEWDQALAAADRVRNDNPLPLAPECAKEVKK